MTLDEIQARADAASKELDRLAGGNPGTNWRWSIPAQPDRDTDLILSASQMDVPRLVKALRAVESRTATWHQDYKDIDPRWSTDDIGFIRRDGRDDAAHEIDAAIREALS